MINKLNQLAQSYGQALSAEHERPVTGRLSDLLLLNSLKKITMLIKEVTNAQDQLSLLKRVIDLTWSAISAEAAEEAASKQKRAATQPRSTKPIKPKIKRPVPIVIKPKQAAADIKQGVSSPAKTMELPAGPTSTTQVATPQQVPRVDPAPEQPATMIATTSMPVARLGKVMAVPARN